MESKFAGFTVDTQQNFGPWTILTAMALLC